MADPCAGQYALLGRIGVEVIGSGYASVGEGFSGDVQAAADEGRSTAHQPRVPLAWIPLRPPLSGSMMRSDLSAFCAPAQMGVGDLIRPARRPVEVPAEMLSEGVSKRHIEIMPCDLAKIVYEANSGQVEYGSDDSIATVHDDGARSR